MPLAPSLSYEICEEYTYTQFSELCGLSVGGSPLSSLDALTFQQDLFLLNKDVILKNRLYALFIQISACDK